VDPSGARVANLIVYGTGLPFFARAKPFINKAAIKNEVIFVLIFMLCIGKNDRFFG
jgi:hypothetical protein|tara:strand:+ start:402 stop:569 length:168 start_codon:yes stop_codon:yes gene_type:complete